MTTRSLLLLVVVAIVASTAQADRAASRLELVDGEAAAADEAQIVLLVDGGDDQANVSISVDDDDETRLPLSSNAIVQSPVAGASAQPTIEETTSPNLSPTISEEPLHNETIAVAAAAQCGDTAADCAERAHLCDERRFKTLMTRLCPMTW